MENAKIHILGCAAVVVSGIKLDDWKLAEKYAPDLLTIVDECNEPVFRVMIDENCPGKLIDSEAVFSSKCTKEGYATITVVIDPEVDDVEETVISVLGKGLNYLIEVEKFIRENMEGIHETKKEIEASVERI